MYKMKPPHVYVHRRVYKNPRAVVRLERMLEALGNPPTREITSADAAEVIAEAGPPSSIEPMDNSVRMGLDPNIRDPSLIFNTFAWEESDRDEPLPAEKFRDWHMASLARAIAGRGDDFAFSRRDSLVCAGVRYVCQGGWGLHSLMGCPHKCDYCYEGYLANIMLDLEDFVEHIYPVIMSRSQRLYRYDMYSDSICFEPEYGASALLSEMFARSGDKYLLYYTKSDNVDHLLDLPHKSNSIFYLTLASETVCREIEKDTPSMAPRIEALRRCQQAGYEVRVGFSPIIPVKNWRQEATDCLEQLFAAVRPRTVRLWALSLMSPAAALRAFGDGGLDEQFMRLVRENNEFNPGEVFDQPFPHSARAEIYAHYISEIRRISPETPVSLCSERREVWDMLADQLCMSPDELFCCCGGMSAP